MFPVLIHGGGADGLEVTSGQSRLKNVGGVYGTLGSTSANDCMQFVNEQHNVSILPDLIHHLLHALLKLTTVLCASHHCAHIKGYQSLIDEGLGNPSLNNALGQPFSNGRLTYAGVTNENRVVLCAAAQDLDYPLNLLVPANHRI